ncbi:GTP-binding protein, partial [Streptomyces sp. PRKS01-65]|nr:GTP-binding protein [Streptomyces harenosi]
RIRIAFVGRPNVGKSTLVNRILGEERMIASDVPGTTRDSIAVDLERDGREYRLIDTAGLRRRSRVDEVVEKFSVVKTMQSIEQCQVAVLMLDATEGVTDQDATVLGAVLDAGRALVIAINKWDGLTEYQR